LATQLNIPDSQSVLGQKYISGCFPDLARQIDSEIPLTFTLVFTEGQKCEWP